MPLRIVQSKQNSRLKELRAALARPGSPDSGVAGIEGPRLVAEAVRSGLAIDTVFVAQGSERLLDGLGIPDGVEILVFPQEILTSALVTETPQPIAALVRPPLWTWEHLLDLKRDATPLILVLAGLQDPGNLGTILRSAEAFGATGIVALSGTVSAWNPKAVRASAGSVFRVPYLTSNVEDCIPRLHRVEATIFATLSRAAQEAHQANLAKPVAMIIGNEGNGVPGELVARADSTITIPCPGPVESLNAAVAASVLLYEAARQRAAQPSTQRAVRAAR
ncbi:MAG: RNA methyltransferase [Terracidiphilus sp.]|jgi:TrmH family RNA methyltransferase